MDGLRCSKQYYLQSQIIRNHLQMQQEDLYPNRHYVTIKNECLHGSDDVGNAYDRM